MKTITVNCPRCGLFQEGRPALSRTDNKTDICSNCGHIEAIEEYYEMLKPQSEWVRERRAYDRRYR